MQFSTHILSAYFVCAVLAVPMTASASRDPLIDGARLCTQRFPVEEERQGIPTHLLAAIATTESGRWHEGLGMSVPWPWTINVEGKGYYFNSKAEAIAQTQRFISQGRQSIDVGCMQVNLKHHPKAFADLNQAFAPEANVAYAAKFLHDNYADLGDWIKATAAYHSRTAVHGNQYLGQIEKSWNRIVAKVSSARANMGASGNGATRGGFDTAAMPASQSGKSATPRVASGSAGNVKRMSLANTPRNARVIKVRDELSPTRRDVLVIRANPSSPSTAPVAEAQARPEEKPAVAPMEAMLQEGGTPSASTIRRVSLDKQAPSPISGAGNDPTFVFAN